MSRQIFDVESKYVIVEGFSARLNELLNKCGYSSPGEGRGKELISFFNISKGSATQWLTKDKPPVWATLNTLVDKLLSANNLSYNQERVVAWLLHSGNVIENPLETVSKPRSQRLLDAVIYSELEKISVQHGVDIFSFDQKMFDRLYNKVLAYFDENQLSSPDDIREADRLILGGYLLLAQTENVS